MNDLLAPLRVKLRFWAVFLGVAQVTFGCLVGLIPPTAVPYFKGIVNAHVQFTGNGVLLIVIGLLATELYLNRFALKLWFITLQVGTWTNGFSGLIAGFTGSTSAGTPTMNAQFPPPHGTNNPLVMGILILCSITILIALFLTLYGWWRRR